jgi:hypothetical protein
VIGPGKELCLVCLFGRIQGRDGYYIEYQRSVHTVAAL